MRILLIVILMQSALLAQAPAIVSVVDALRGDTRLAPGSRALIRLTQRVAPDSVTVQVGGKQAAILVPADERVYVLLPVDLPPGPATVVVTSRGISTAAFPLTLMSHAPVLASTSFWPGNYCPFFAPWGTSLVAYGLGATEPAVPALAEAPTMPLAATVLKPTVTVAGREAEVLSSALVPGRTNDGSYAIDFRVPPGTSAGGHPVMISIGGHTSNTEMLRVASAITKSAATGWESPGAPEAIISASACAAPLATAEASGDARNPGTMLAGTKVEVKDSSGVERLALLLSASPRQVDYVIPAGTASGPATAKITSGDGTVSTAALGIENIAPELFSVSNANYAAALILRVRDGVHTIEPVIREVDGRIEPVPIDLGPATDRVFLMLFGTGIRNRSSLGSVTASIGGIDVPVEFAGPQGEYAGLDQVNLRLVASLSVLSGQYAEVLLTVDDESANEVYLVFR